MTDLIDRLRVIADKTIIGPQTILKAADEIERLRVENARLRTALRPLADAYDIARKAVVHPITANHLRAIAAYELSLAFHRAGIVLADCAALENSHD